MWGKIRPLLRILLIAWLILVWLSVTGRTWAQDEGEEEATPQPVIEPKAQIVITGDDVTSPPSIILHVYGRDVDGNAIDFTRDPLRVTHNGTAVLASADDSYPGGTLTVFLIDIPTGVSEQLPALSDAIQAFTSPGSGMQEQVDTIAIYQVGETEAQELLPPTTFYNAVDNFFVEALTPEVGSTALRDSIGSMLGKMEALKPESTTPVSIVVMSDGTDVVSTGNELEELVSRAIELNIPIHTVWVSSTDLTIDGQNQGQAFLQDLASGSQGLATFLDDSEGLANIWTHIATFREQTGIRYIVDGLTGGTYNVDLSLTSDPKVTASMAVEVPENQPQVVLDIPPGSDSISLPNLDEPIPLRLGATVTWLDGIPRGLTAVRLRVNDQDVAELPVDQIDDFTVEISNLKFGENKVEVVVTDDQDLRATNLPVIINVAEGEEEIPPDLKPGLEIGSLVLNIFLVLVVLGVLVGIFFWVSRSKRISLFMPRGRSERSRKGVTYTTNEPPDAQKAAFVDSGTTTVMGYLYVLDSISEMPERLDLSGSVISIGRSPSQADIAFREDLTVSRKHASLMLEGNHFRLFDENSTSGTWVNGRQVPEYGVELVDGDEIHLGAVHLIYRLA